MSEENGKPAEKSRANTLSGVQKYRLVTYIDVHRDRLSSMRSVELVKEVSEAMGKMPDPFAVSAGNVAGAFKTLGLEYPRTRKDTIMRAKVTGKFGELADKVAAVELVTEDIRGRLATAEDLASAESERIDSVSRVASGSAEVSNALAKRVAALEGSAGREDAAKVAAGLLDKFAELASTVGKVAADLQTLQIAVLTLRREWDKVEFRNRDRGHLRGGK